MKQKLAFLTIAVATGLGVFFGVKHAVPAPASFAAFPATPVITTTTLPLAKVGVAYSATITGIGGKSPYFWLLCGNLPQGINLKTQADTGRILLYGTPVKAETHVFVLALDDSSGGDITKRLGRIEAGFTCDNYQAHNYPDGLNETFQTFSLVVQ